jgi:hypothetical protein
MLNQSKNSTNIVMPSFEDLGIDKAKILRIIETLKVNGQEIHPGSIALELGIPRTFIYENLDILEIIYSNMERPFGHDKLIQELLLNKNKFERKIKKLEKLLDEREREARKNFNEGFSQGASLNFEKRPDINLDLSIEKEIWARSSLYIGLDQKLDFAVIKKAYRKMVSLIHPDLTKEDTNEMMNSLSSAYNYLLSQYN